MSQVISETKERKMLSETTRATRLSTIVALAMGCFIGTLLVTSVGTAPAEAKEYNKRPFLAPDYNSRVQRAVTHGRTEKFRQKDAAEEQVNKALNPNAIVTNTGCGKLKVGGVTTSGKRGERVPRENITVVGQVINAPVNCNVRDRIGK
jgi:hypothetical protein